MNESAIITVGEITYRRGGERSTSVPIRGRRTVANGQPYLREIIVDEAWRLLDIGWVVTVGKLVLANEEGKFFETQPTDEERHAINRRVIEIACQDRNDTSAVDASVLFEVHPGDAFPVVPHWSKRLWVRCREGQARAMLTVFPG